MSTIAVVTALSVLTDLVTASLEIGIQIQKVSGVIQQAQLENREISEEEWAVIELDKNTAFDRLQKAIDAAGTTA